MLQLEADGLVETLPRVGTRVRVLTLDDLQGQLVLREALECQAARLYCGAPVRRHFERLTRLARTIDVRDPTSPEHVKEEIVFHHSLVSLANVRILTQAYTKVMKTSFLYAVQTLQPAGGKVTRASHVQLVQSLTTDNADAAETAARAHAQSGKEALFDQWAAARRALGDDIPGWPG
jgi:DNA-binding GntR family transcriptional regulator